MGLCWNQTPVHSAMSWHGRNRTCMVPINSRARRTTLRYVPTITRGATRTRNRLIRSQVFDPIELRGYFSQSATGSLQPSNMRALVIRHRLTILWTRRVLPPGARLPGGKSAVGGNRTRCLVRGIDASYQQTPTARVGLGRFELPTFPLSEECSNQTKLQAQDKSERMDLNHRPRGPKPRALPTALRSDQIPSPHCQCARRESNSPFLN